MKISRNKNTMGNRKISVLRERFRKSTAKEKIINIFLLCLLVCAAVFLVEWVVWIIGNGYFFALPLFHQNWNDTFMDFFNVNYFVAEGRNPYGGESVSSYPPLILIIAKIFACMGDYSVGSVSTRSQVGGIVSLVLYFLVCFGICAFSFYLIAKRLGFKKYQIFLSGCVLFFSAPLLFLIERGNYLLLALAFVLLFFALYESKSRVVRELSYLSLAVAFGIKLYPIAFGIVLVKDRRRLAIVRLAVYCILLFFVPFFFFSGGLANFLAFIKNLISFTAYDTPYNNYALYQIWYSIRNLFGQTPVSSTAVTVSKIISYCICLLCVISAFLCRKKWQSLLSASLFSIYITQPCYLYTGVMLIVPILYFLAEEEKSKKDWFILVLFVIMMQPMYLGYIVYNSYEYLYHVTVSVFLQSLALLALVVCCVVFAAESVRQSFSEKRALKRQSKESPAESGTEL